MSKLGQPSKQCPHCQAINAAQATLCTQCLRSLLDFGQLDPPVAEETARTRSPRRPQKWWRRLKHWWNKRGRRAE